MATPVCDIDGSRPAVATVRIRENGRVVTRNLCDVHLAEARAGRLGLGDGGSGGGRSLFDEFFSDFFEDFGGHIALNGEFKALANAHILELSVAEPLKGASDGLALGVKQFGLGHDINDNRGHPGSPFLE